MERLLKLIIIGDPTVGKTSFVQRYVNDTFRRDYKGTIGVDFALKVVQWSENETLKLQLWDIAGQERFTSMTRVYYKDAHACVIMFDLTQKKTFENTITWKKDLDSKCTLPDGSLVPCILLANKCDLQYREVEQVEIENLCKEHDFIGWTEISVKDGLMIDEAMKFLLDEVMTLFGDIDQDSTESQHNIRLGHTAENEKASNQCSC
ncbi:ras-related protein Rab-7L1-like [Tubulanus polymorphus]|uniref:ras-related protein Rab-7L1-like n=1 Tax=Tubulanus polymorphus TaxID=672921 RepID=UPI003DA625C1